MGIVFALLLLVLLPGLCFGPFITTDVPWSLWSTEATAIAISSALAGLWLLVVCFVANDEDIEKVMEPFGAAEGAILFLPYMIYVGTRAIWRRIR